MKHSLWLAPALLLGSGLLPVTAAPADTPDEDAQDVLFLSQVRPVLVRLHLSVDGQPFGVRWKAQLAKLFALLDRNEDGFLDREEAARAPNGLQLSLWLDGNPVSYSYGAPPSFADMDFNGDGKVSLAEFTRYYLRAGAGPVQLARLTRQGGRDVLSETLFKVLDVNRDGKLSREELAAAPDLLRRFDQDDDEMITPQELLPQGPFLGYVLTQMDPARTEDDDPATPLLLVYREAGTRRLTQRVRIAQALLARYDADGDRRLARWEIGLPGEVFDRLDTNHDGKLELLELLRWLPSAPDVEAVVRLGGPANQEGVEQIVPAGPSRNAPTLRQAAGGMLTLTVDGDRVQLIRLPRSQSVQGRFRSYYLERFRVLDRGRKGFITQEQVQAPQYLPLRGILQLADHNGDGKLTEKELTDYLDLVDGAASCLTTVTFAETGRGLFTLLDADGDGRLSVRELRSAGARLAEFDRDGDGCLSPAEMPRQFEVAVCQGGLSPGYFTTGGAGTGHTPVAVPRGPLWFRKMDRNRDGDVSRSEFLGSLEDFKRIDKDGDGLISLEEALQADAWFRRRHSKGP